MVFTTAISRIDFEPGSVATIPNVSWSEFESILQELGESRSSRIAYSDNTLELMVPLPDHERSIVLISDLVKIILRKQNRHWESLRSTTFRQQVKAAGLEPDDCFYLANYQAVIGKDRIDLAIDPPPDLAIESDYTSKTKLDAYLLLGVPELWIYDRELKIYLLVDEDYIEAETSPNFADLPIKMMIDQIMVAARRVGTSQALWDFETQLD